MAKNKKSKILASMLAVSTMAVFYAAPVMAAKFTLDSNSSVTTETTTSTGGYTQNEVRVNISDGFSSDTIGTFYSNKEEAGFKTDYTMTANTFKLEAGGEIWASLTVGGLEYTDRNTLNNVSLTADGLTFSNLNSEATAVLNAAAINSWNEKTQNIDVTRTSAGTTTFKGNVNVDGAVNAGNGSTVGGVYFHSGNVAGINILNGASVKGDNAGGLTISGVNFNENVLTAGAMNLNGATGGFYVKDIDGHTMIYAGATHDGPSTLRIDPENGNLATKGTISVGSDLEKPVTMINGDNSQGNIGDIAVGINYNTDDTVAGANIILDADTGNVVAKGGITAADFNDVTLAKNGEQVLVGGIDISALKEGVDTANDAVGGIRRSEGAGEPGTGTTTIEKATSFDANGMRVTNENDSRAVAITKDRGIEVFGGNGASNAVITNNGTARFGDKDGANVRIENGDVTSTYYDEDGKVGHYSLNNIGDKTQNMWADGSQTNFSHSVNVEGSFSAGNGGAQLNGAWGKEASLKLRDAGKKTYTLTATQLGNINNVILENGVVNGAAGSVIGGVRFSGGGDLNKVNHINGALIEAYDADPDNGVSGLRISGVAMENGAIKVNAINGATVNYYGEGGLEISGVGMLNGEVRAQTFNGVSIEKDTDGSAVIGGIDIGNLNENVDAATEDIGGIERFDKLTSIKGLDTTSIEGRLVVNKEELVIGGYGEGNSLTINADGARFAGDVVFNNGYDVSFSYGENGSKGTSLGKLALTVDGLVDTVNDIYDRTQGISHNADGSTTIESGTRNPETGEFTSNGSKVTIGKDGATFENGEGNGTTNINGGAIDADSSSIGDNVSGGSGSGSSGMAGDGTYTDGSEHSGHFVDGDNSYEFTNDANGFTGTVTDGKNTTTIENGAMGSNTTVKGDNASASSGVGIGNDGAFISDSVTNGDISHTVNGGSITDTVTNGDMTVTEVKDENGSATTVKDANGSSTVSQNTNGQTVSTGTGTSVNTGNDFGVTDNETGKSIYMSDIGHVEDIDSEIQNSDGSKTTVVDAVNNEAEIRRNEIERVDGRINNLENRVGELEDRIDKVGAMAAAIANLRTMGYDPAAPTEVAVGIGQYRDETGAALGLFHYPNRDFMLSLSVSTSGDEVMGGIGATWKFGRKSPEKVAEIKKAQAEADARRAEEAKLAKAEEMKQAAKEAKIKAQQERHAKLAAERAAQAEAAK